MAEALAEWAGSLRSGVVTILVCTTMTCGTMVFTAVQGFASDEDLTRVELESIERDAKLLKKLEEHLEAARKAELVQAEFRGAVAAKLKIKLQKGE